MDQPEVLVRSLAIAVVIVLPYAIRKVRQVNRNRSLRDRITAREQELQRRSRLPHGDMHALEDVIADVDFVAAEARRSGAAMLVVPHTVTVSDRPAPPEIVATLVRDALARSNLVVTAEVDSPEGRMLECAIDQTHPKE